MEIVVYPNPLLRKKCEKVNRIDEKLLSFLNNDFFNFMVEKDGIGLAAIQVGILKRFFVMQTPLNEENFKKKIVINPEIIEFSKESILYEEGCLSLPGIYARVLRPKTIVVQYINENMDQIKEELSGIEARVFQHEYDHLNGVLFTDRLTQIEFMKIKNQLKELKIKYKNVR